MNTTADNNTKIKTVQSLKKEEQEQQKILFNNCGLFWAFSDEQFQANKTPLQDGEKYVSIGAGGYLPKSKIEMFQTGMKEISNWYKSETKKNKALKVDLIRYELSNHEAYYTGSIEDTLSALGSGFTAKEVWAVYNKEYSLQDL